MKVSNVTLHKAEEILSKFDSIESVKSYIYRFINPLNHSFLDDREEALFIVEHIGCGIYGIHLYLTKRMSMLSLREWVFSCIKEVTDADPEMRSVINVVKKKDRHLRLMMHRLFKSEKIKTFENGDVMFITPVSIAKE